MAEEQRLPEDSVGAEEELHAYEEVLEEYRRRQMVEHLTGPMVSIILHALVVVGCAILLAGKEIRDVAGVEFDIKEMQIKPLEPETLEQLDDLEEEILEDVVPTVEKPTVQPESVSAADTADFADAMAATEMDVDLSSMLEMQSTTPLKLAGLYSNRTAGNREKALKKHAGRLGEHTERAVLKALRWLKEHQSEDGSWSPQHQEAMTGLGLLTFLAHGETPASEEFGLTVQKAIQWLSNRMLAKREDRVDGRGYSHGIATYAMAEAYALTKLPLVKPAAEKALGLVVRGQQPRGGWDYGYAKGERWDLSVSAWQMQAMKAGYAAGLAVDGLEAAIEKGIEFARDVAYKDGRFGYSSPGAGSWGMTGAGALCLQLLGEGESSEAKAGVRSISEGFKPNWDEKGKYATHSHPSYGWYYMTQALFHGGTGYFRPWNAVFAPMLVKHQDPDGHWECPGAANEIGEFDPYYSTTLNALSLQVYYRYLPTYQAPTAIVDKGDVLDIDDDEDLDLEIE